MFIVCKGARISLSGMKSFRGLQEMAMMVPQADIGGCSHFGLWAYTFFELNLASLQGHTGDPQKYPTPARLLPTLLLARSFLYC
jgi:hypothetical protein